MNLIKICKKTTDIIKLNDKSLMNCYAKILNSGKFYNKYPIIDVFKNKGSISREIEHIRGSLQVANNHQDFTLYFLWKDLLYSENLSEYSKINTYNWILKDTNQTRGLCIMEPSKYASKKVSKFNDTELNFMFNMCEFLKPK